MLVSPQESSLVRWEVDCVAQVSHTLVSCDALVLPDYATHLWDTLAVYVMKLALKRCHRLHNNVHNLCQAVEIVSAGIDSPRQLDETVN